MDGHSGVFQSNYCDKKVRRQEVMLLMPHGKEGLLMSSLALEAFLGDVISPRESIL